MPERYDSHYTQEGRANIFIALEPLRNWRGTQVTVRRTQVDFAHFIKWLVDDVYADARLIHLVLDNLNTHTPATFDKAFPPAEAHRLAQRVQFHTIRPNTAVG